MIRQKFGLDRLVTSIITVQRDGGGDGDFFLDRVG